MGLKNRISFLRNWATIYIIFELKALEQNIFEKSILCWFPNSVFLISLTLDFQNFQLSTFCQESPKFGTYFCV